MEGAFSNTDLVYKVQESTLSQKQMQNGQVISDFRMVDTRTANGTVTGVRQKVMDYIFYSAVTGTAGPNTANCTSMCGQGIFSQKCCASVNLWNRAQTRGDFFYVCVDKSLAAADMTMNVSKTYVAITCVESGSMRLVGLTVSALLALVSAM